MFLKECFVLCERMHMNTPSNSDAARPRRAPTPKMSERKKKLFADSDVYVLMNKSVINEEEDSDLGPMSPLEFSSSPSSFRRIMGCTASDYTIERNQSHRSTFENILGDSKVLIRTQQRSAPRELSRSEKDDNDINDNDFTELPHSDDEKFRGKENYALQMKTPNELNSTNSSVNGFPRVQSFKKSLLFDTGLTPNAAQSGYKSMESNEMGSNEHPKAKTSLQFSEPMFSAKSFYGRKDDTSSVAKTDLPSYMLTNKLPLLYTETAKSKARRKNTRKSTSLRGPMLWKHGGAIRKIRGRALKTVQRKKRLEDKWLKSAKGEMGRRLPKDGSDEKRRNSDANADAASVRHEQRRRLKKIFEEQTNVVSRPINWMKPGVRIMDHTFGDSDSDEDEIPSTLSFNETSTNNELNNQEENEDPNEVKKSRKFFKSSVGSTAKKYRIIGGIHATLKRGCDIKLDRPVKRIKRARHSGTGFLHNEITGIINRLSSPQKAKEQVPANTAVALPADPFNEPSATTNEAMDALSGELHDEQKECRKYIEMLPYQTDDPSKIKQQESILELLISNGICNDDTFKIFIAEPDLHKDEASRILDKLYCVTTMMPANDAFADKRASSQHSLSSTSSSPRSKSTSVSSGLDQIEVEPKESDVQPDAQPMPMSPASQISDMTLSLAIHCTSKEDKGPKSPAESSAVNYFPIFSKNASSTNAMADTNKPLFDGINNKNKKWRTIGDRQYQIDAGQKEFGMKTCTHCEMAYSVHEPEDELLHMQYHNAVSTLSFKGWTNERLITQVPEWGIQGRIILVCETDSKSKKIRVKDILSVVDRHLGFARSTLAPKTLVYLAIAKNQVIGVCVAQPLAQANRLISENGLDFCSIQIYTVKCGISRIWVAPPYRRFGVASRLITAVRGHFIFGKHLKIDEIAFSSPTEDGKRFASKLCQRDDFLVYDA